MIEVYSAPPSIYGRKILIVLMEKNLDFRIKPMSFFTKDHRKEAYLELNPNGEIPTLIDEGRIIYESTAIMEYLNEAYPEPPLMPTQPYQRALIRMIDDFCDLHLYRAIIQVIVKKMFTHETVTEQDLEGIIADSKRIENYLGDQEFLAGDFSLADCAFMSALPAFQAFGLESKLRESRTLSAYADRLKIRPSYKAAMMVTDESIKDYHE